MDIPFFENGCLDMCAESKCCFNGSCENKKEFCAAQVACETVHRPSIACSGDLEKDHGLHACKNACNTFSCCWEEGGCYALNEKECLSDIVCNSIR